MKSFDWTKWSAVAEILGAVAIVATLVYLALQTRYLADQTQLLTVQTEQNNEFLLTSTQTNRISIAAGQSAQMMQLNAQITSDEGFAAIMHKWETGESLSGVERLRFAGWVRQFVTISSFQYELFRAGVTSEPEFRRGFASIRAFATDPLVREIMDETGGNLQGSDVGEETLEENSVFGRLLHGSEAEFNDLVETLR